MKKFIAVLSLVLVVLVGCEGYRTTVTNVTFVNVDQDGSYYDVALLKDGEGDEFKLRYGHVDAKLLVEGTVYKVTFDRDFYILEIEPVLSGVVDSDDEPPKGDDKR